MRPGDLLLALLANALWAFNFIAIKVGTLHFEPIWFTSLRFALLLVLLGPLLRVIAGQSYQLITIGVVVGAAHFSFMMLGVKAAPDVSSTAILTQLYVPFSAIFASIFLAEKVQWTRWLGIACACGGVALMSFDPVIFKHPQAAVMIIIAALLLAIGTILMRRVTGVGVLQLQAWIALSALPVLLPLSLALETQHLETINTADWLEWGTVAYAAIASSLLGHGIVFYLLQRYPVSITTPVMLLTPLMAIGFGILIWGDQPSARLLGGGALILLGVVIVSLGKLPRLSSN